MTTETLLQIIPKCPKPWADAIVAVMPDYDINTWQRQSAFIAQIAHESTELTRLEENLYYTNAERIALIFRGDFDKNKDKTISPEELEFAKQFVKNPKKLANYVYANQNGNGNELSGDGWNFRGRCPINLTGRGNYLKIGEMIKQDLISYPEKLLEPIIGIEASCAFWNWKGLNSLSDMADLKSIRKRTNGGLIGYDQTVAYYEKAKKVLCG